jgi:hypothetical protein
MDYYPQITAARRIIADHAGYSPFRVQTWGGKPRWNRTAGLLMLSEPVFNALRREGHIQESYLEEGAFRAAP